FNFFQLFDNLKLSKQTEEANCNDDSTINGVVQKLCARFLQLSKESNTVPHLRSSCFKRRKASAENNFTVISEIRRCTSSKLTNKILNLNAETDEMNNHCDGQKYKMDFVPAEMKVVDRVKLNGTYLYHATVIPADTKPNRKAKKIESIREKFEKISATTSTLPSKKVNKIRFRRDCNVPIVNARKVESVEMQGQIQKAQNDGNIVRMVVKLAPSDDNPTITELPTIPTVSCLPNFQVISF
ncbi:unnamed protein product, partial [Wuchereria bancrofti]